jgi:hypothetical protein
MRLRPDRRWRPIRPRSRIGRIPHPDNEQLRESAMVFRISQLSLRTLFHYRANVRGEAVQAHRVTNPYHAVSILAGARACSEALKCADARFLSAHVPPPLPLPDCDSERCTCRYKHHDDRRAGPRREDASDRGLHRWRGPERRRSPGRRAGDGAGED